MSSPFNEIEESRHADILYASFKACGHMTPEELSEGVVSVKKLREICQRIQNPKAAGMRRLSAEHRAIMVGTVEELFLVLTGKELPQ